MATWVTPRVWVAGERVSAAKMNEISTDLGILFPHTTAGDLAFRSSASADLTRLAFTTGGVLIGGASLPEWLSPGTERNVLTIVGGVPAYAPPIYRRQGGDASNWQSAGTTSYTPSGNVVRQVGVKSVSVNTSGTASVSYPVAFAQRPIVTLGVNSGSGAITVRFTGDSVNGFDLALRDVLTSGAITVDINWSAEGVIA